MKLILRFLYNLLFVNSSRRYLEDFLRRAAAAAPPGARVLDAGAGDGRYRHLFLHTQYEATDFGQVHKHYVFERLDFLSDLRHLPVAEDYYDQVICSQVLEHINEPAQMLQQLHQVLKPGGTLWLSTPLFYAEHETPHDYFRYTQFGLRYLLEKSGFDILQLEWLEGYYGTLAYQSLSAALALPVLPRHYGGGAIGWSAALLALPLKPLLALASILATYLDLRHKVTHVGLCKNYTVVARKSG
ncbi:MAG: class I SAM-dependent methyltransferase [Chloroflexi bacterium]|nr:MAG: class I SAM-dependent methyltransferase [Chloroflexota bacterium]